MEKSSNVTDQSGTQHFRMQIDDVEEMVVEKDEIGEELAAQVEHLKQKDGRAPVCKNLGGYDPATGGGRVNHARFRPRHLATPYDEDEGEQFRFAMQRGPKDPEYQQWCINNKGSANCEECGYYYGKDMLDLTDRNCIRNLPTYDVLIHTATGNNRINDNLPLLFSKAKKIFTFTSKQGTFVNWNRPGPLSYGLEKLTLNFIVYRHNMENHTAQNFEPGHMETV